MSAVAAPAPVGAGVTAPVRPCPRAVTASRPLVRLAAFTALAGYALSRWTTLMRPVPGWRFAGLLALAVLVAAGVGPLARRSRPMAGAAFLAIVLLAFPVAGLRWHWLTHLRVAATADRIGTGLTELPRALVPYLGSQAPVRLVIVLGAAVLVLDAAAVLAFAGRTGADFGDGRRAAAALPLIALAIVPSTLIRPAVPYLQGLVLFALLAAFVWGERVRGSAVRSAMAVIALGGLAAVVVAPRVDQRHPWVNYRAWAGAAALPRTDRFDWNQTYGPLRWPRGGHVVMTVAAARPDYWKAENLDLFDGTRWRYGAATAAPPLAPPNYVRLRRYIQTIQVDIRGMQTPNIIAAGTASAPLASIPGGYAAGLDPGTWVPDRPLGPGASYRIEVYSPRPAPRRLAAAGRGYPAGPLAGDLTLGIPRGGAAVGATELVRFPVFGSHASPSATLPPPTPASALAPAPAPAIDVAALLRRSPYAPAYALARRLAAGAATPYAFVTAVMGHLGPGFAYDENPPTGRYPLLTFLFGAHRGYCQQFSGAMALLLRMGGIPARVASGFTPGTISGQRWVVTDTDAHAWVEVWFPKLGWVRFDPTPAADPALRGATIRAGDGKLLGLPLTGSGQPTRGASATGLGSLAITAARRRGASEGAWPLVAGAAALVALVVLLGALAAGQGGPRDLVAELERAMIRARRPLPTGATLTTLERRMVYAPEAAGYVHALSRARYGAGGPEPTGAQRRALRRELSRGLGLPGRLRALWALPPRRSLSLRRDHGAERMDQAPTAP